MDIAMGVFFLILRISAAIITGILSWVVMSKRFQLETTKRNEIIIIISVIAFFVHLITG